MKLSKLGLFIDNVNYSRTNVLQEKIIMQSKKNKIRKLIGLIIIIIVNPN